MIISIRKHIDNYQTGLRLADNLHPAEEEEIPKPMLSQFRALLLAIGQSAERAVPGLDTDLNRYMAALEKTLEAPTSIERLTATNQQVQTEMATWADHAFTRNQDVERELREIIAVVSGAAESLTDRDAKYVREIGDLTGRLSSIVKQDDLGQIRRSIVDSTRALKDCVARMTEDNKASVEHLTAEVRDYRTRLEEAERVSQTDTLTNLSNRRAFERYLAARIAERKPFCLIMLDLNDFKEVNDRLGHLAGDDLLRQFAAELRSNFTAAEIVCRWGGDEFVAVILGRLDEAHARADRIRKWSLGEYKIAQAEQQVKTQVNASIGIAEWNGQESGQQLLARTDKEVYRCKKY